MLGNNMYRKAGFCFRNIEENSRTRAQIVMIGALAFAGYDPISIVNAKLLTQDKLNKRLNGDIRKWFHSFSPMCSLCNKLINTIGY